MLQDTLKLVLKKQSSITSMDKQVVAECLDIYVSCVTFNNEMLLDVYGESDESSNSEIAGILTDQGLFSELSGLRS